MAEVRSRLQGPREDNGDHMAAIAIAKGVNEAGENGLAEKSAITRQWLASGKGVRE